MDKSVGLLIAFFLFFTGSCINADSINSRFSEKLEEVQSDSLRLLRCDKLLKELKQQKLDTIKSSQSIPTSLDNALTQLDTLINKDFQEWIRCLPDQNFSVYTHHSLGNYLRNKWSLWSNSPLVDFFNEKEIFHPDDMSSIILDSYQRKIKGQDVQLEQQIKVYKDFWDKKSEENKK